MDGASERKLSDASASSNNTRVEEYCHYVTRLGYPQHGGKQYFPVEKIALDDNVLGRPGSADFSWMQRPQNTFPVPTGKQQTDMENVIHYIMRYVMNG